LSRHSELEQSETKAQAALITVLSLTQITELKLLLDIGRQGHRFYDFVLAMLIACISLEIFIGIIIIYIGNLHYYQVYTFFTHTRTHAVLRASFSPVPMFDSDLMYERIHLLIQTNKPDIITDTRMRP
jgi:hypothetical protein